MADWMSRAECLLFSPSRIPQEQFEAAQRIREDRSKKSAEEAEQRVPYNIHGQALLSGNVYCGHCGSKLTLTTSRKWRKLPDGALDDTLRMHAQS